MPDSCRSGDRRPWPARRVALAAALLLAVSHRPLAAQTLTQVSFAVPTAAFDSVRRLGIDLVEIRPRAGGTLDLVAVITPRDRALLQARGWLPVDVPRAPDAVALDARRAAVGAAAFTVYRDYDDPVRGYAAWLRAFDASHTNVTLDSIGVTFEGRPIFAAKVGAPNDDPTRPNVIFMATYHAREWAATETARRLLEYLADSLPLQPGGAGVLASRDVWIIPVANPDGYQYTFTTTRLWRKNRRPNGDGTTGVDINRNHASLWGFDDAGSSPVPASEVYRGASAASELETRAIEAFHRAHPPTAAVSYHTYTGVVLYPWSHEYGVRTGDDAIFRALAGTDVAPAIADSLPGSVNSYYHPGPGWHLYEVNGDYTTYAYRTFRTMAFTVELTSGCCVGGQAYGFDFPDSEPLLARLFRDNLPFALGLLSAAGNIVAGNLAPGVPPASPQFESVWPEVRVLIDAPAPSTGSVVDVVTDSGLAGFTLAPRDTLGTGRRYARMVTTHPALVDLRAVRLPSDGLRAELLSRDGAEQPGTPWHGFKREEPGFASATAWHGFADTLVGPAVNVAGRTNLSLYFWTRHFGSVFAQGSRGRVQVSADNGATWTTVADVVGAAPEWYPVRAALPDAATLRLRFIANQMDWLVDAIAIVSGDAYVSRLFGPAATRVDVVDVSANPVTAAPVTLRWPPGPGSARVDLFSLTGTQVNSLVLPTDVGRVVWDLRTSDGREVANGSYFIVVTRGDGTRIRRRLLVAR